MDNKSTPSEQVNLDFTNIEKAVVSLLSKNLRPDVDNIRMQLNLQDSSKDNVIEYFLYIWEQRKAPIHIDDINNHIVFNKDQKNVSIEEMKQRTAQLEDSLAMMRATLEATADGILFLNNEGKLVGFNHKFIDIYQFPEDVLKTKDEAIILKYVFDMVKDPVELVNLVTEKYKNPIAGYCGAMFFKDGRIIDRYYQPQEVDEKVIGHVWSFRDITEREKQEQMLKLKQRSIDASTQGIVIAEKGNGFLNVVEINPAFTRLTGYDKSETIGHCLFSVLKVAKHIIHEIRLIINAGNNISRELQVVCLNNDTLWCELHISPVKNSEDKIEHYVCILVGINDRKFVEKKLVYQATHDFLTQLPNRVLIHDRIDQAIAHAKRKNLGFVLYFIDVDNFKLINDSLGHKIGDMLLNLIGQRLLKISRKDDTTGRLGGDEFILMSVGLKDKLESLVVARRLLEIFSEPFKLVDQTVAITVSVGGCTFPEDGDSAETLMKNADIAMYQAKKCGKNTFEFYHEDLNKQLKHRLMAGSLVSAAIKNQELELAFQPIIDVKTERPVAMEVLIRFPTLVGKQIYVIEAIKIAEESGLINQLGNWVLSHACKAQNELHKILGKSIKTSINVSGYQIRDNNFVKSVKTIFEAEKVNPRDIELELTETVLMTSVEEGLIIFKELNESMGIDLSIDDFGTGYSSFEYLTKLPISKIKIDKSFIDKILTTDSGKLVVKAMISMTKSLNLMVVAEGVETAEQVKVLQELNCDLIQGYYYSKPLNMKDLIIYMQKFYPNKAS